MTIRVVLIHDHPKLRQVLSELLGAWEGHHVEVEESGYEVRLPGVWKRWIQDADLFVLGLERSYASGTRAEGIKVAERLIHSGKRVLVVGSEASAQHLMSPIYWDIGSEQSFLQTVASCLSTQAPKLDDIPPLSAFFEHRLTVPTGH